MTIFNRMKNRMKFTIVLLLIIMVQLVFISPQQAYAATSRVDLLTADNFAVLGGSAVTGTNTNVITGDVGLSPTGGTAITLLTCSEVTGTIYDTNGGYTGGGGGSIACLKTDASLLTKAKNDLTTASNDAVGRSTTSTIATELGGATLTDGVYDSAAGTFGLTGTLTLNGQGNADSVFIFKAASTLITESSSKVVLTNSAQACNVYWVVGSSATLGTSSTLIGNVMASESITDNGFSTVDGRLLAKTSAVTLNNTTVTKKTCAVGTAGAPTSTPTPTPTATSSSTSNSNSTSNTSTSTNICIDIAPTNSPNLFQIDRTGSKATLYFTPVNDHLSYYYIAYGLSPGDDRYGVTFTAGLSKGVVSYTINDLNPNLTYYFKVRGGNGCTPGGWSNNKESNSKNPSLPNTGFAPHKDNAILYVITTILGGFSILFVLILRKKKCFSRN
ncbi:MAG: ice-binding family protein [bacterium]|nr:ice-binding family protein [bacterium]